MEAISRYHKYKESYLKYREKNLDRLLAYQKNANNRREFGDGNKEIVLSRDGYKCVSCGMTNDEHKELFNRELIIHHIDGNGRNAREKNNDLNNLETLCLRCHSRLERLQYLERTKS